MLVIFITVIYFFFQFSPILISLHLTVLVPFLMFFCSILGFRFYSYILGILILRGLCVLFYYVSCMCFDSLDFISVKKRFFFSAVFLDLLYNFYSLDRFVSLTHVKGFFSVGFSIGLVCFIILYLFAIMVIILKICSGAQPLRFFI